jgi:5-methylcytosine-specific restriction enzyme A
MPHISSGLTSTAPPMADQDHFYHLGDDEAVQRHIRAERQRGKQLRKTPWWKNQIQKGVCHYCRQLVGPENLTMDHIVPLARGGKSAKGNVVPACQTCNHQKNLDTPVETILDQLRPHGE